MKTPDLPPVTVFAKVTVSRHETVTVAATYNEYGYVVEARSRVHRSTYGNYWRVMGHVGARRMLTMRAAEVVHRELIPREPIKINGV